MMPVSVETDKRWCFTCYNDNNGGATWAIGYCRPYRPLNAEECELLGVPFSQFQFDKDEVTKHKHHDNGHDTKEEAYECHRQYCLDHKLRLDGISNGGGAHYPCEVCKELTDKIAECNHQSFNLCDKHRTREEVDKLFTVGYSFGSY